jgi:hypothetical protein
MESTITREISILTECAISCIKAGHRVCLECHLDAPFGRHPPKVQVACASFWPGSVHF